MSKTKKSNQEARLSPGLSVEERARHVAAIAGLPDFVYRVPLVPKGQANREVGDALLIANGHGAVIQVKSREPGCSDRKVANWLVKNGSKAYRQAKGSVRNAVMHRKHGQPLRAFPIRTSQLDVEMQAQSALLLDQLVESWPLIVIIDNPAADGLLAINKDAFWITMADWEELNRLIRSTSGLIDYVQRVLDSPEIPTPMLGHERERYNTVVRAGLAYMQSGGPHARALFTLDALRDPQAVQLYRGLLERVWPDGDALPEVSMDEYRAIVECLDKAMSGVQAEIGRRIAGVHQRHQQSGHWESMSYLVEDNGLVLFACDNVKNYPNAERFDAELQTLAAVRAAEINEQGGQLESVLAVGHLLDADGAESRYSLQRPPAQVPIDLRGTFELAFGTYDMRRGRTVPLRVGRNGHCPCGSGKKHKHCCI